MSAPMGTRRRDARALLTRRAELIDAHEWEALPGVLPPALTSRLVLIGS